MFLRAFLFFCVFGFYPTTPACATAVALLNRQNFLGNLFKLRFILPTFHLGMGTCQLTCLLPMRHIVVTFVFAFAYMWTISLVYQTFLTFPTCYYYIQLPPPALVLTALTWFVLSQTHLCIQYPSLTSCLSSLCLQMVSHLSLIGSQDLDLIYSLFFTFSFSSKHFYF